VAQLVAGKALGIPTGKHLVYPKNTPMTNLFLTMMNGRVGVDPGTLAKWEQGKREPAGAFLARVKRFLQAGETSGARRVG
jgi:hypothetical protein